MKPKIVFVDREKENRYVTVTVEQSIKLKNTRQIKGSGSDPLLKKNGRTALPAHCILLPVYRPYLYGQHVLVFAGCGAARTMLFMSRCLQGTRAHAV